MRCNGGPMNNKNILIIIMMMTVSLSALVGGAFAFMEEESSNMVVAAASITEFEMFEPSSDIVSVNSKNEESEESQAIFTYVPLTEAIIKKIDGVSWRDMAPYPMRDLVYIQVTYYGFDGKDHVGELIMHKKVASEIIEIFKELYDNKFAISKMNLIDEYDADDNASMEDNNTSALCVRTVTNRKDELSKHAYGLAIDINPVQNPYISEDEILPEEGKDYLDRTDVRKGMIVEGDACFNAFIRRGWEWGGKWTTKKDYQHFEKNLDILSLIGDAE